MASSALHDLTLSQAAGLIGSGDLSPLAYTKALIARAEALDPQLNAFITRMFDTAIDEAAVAERDIAEGRYRGPLHGIPFALKDIYDTAGVLTSGHSRTCIGRVPEHDAATVAKLRAAGVVLTGKLATHEFAHGGPSFDLPWPPARNPWNTAHFTGGSSSGSGAAVAAGLVPGTLGSDTGGSIRGPAGLCGIAGMKPTYGLVSRAGVLPNCYSYDTCGPLARTAEDCALILNAIAGYDDADPASAHHPVEDYTAELGAGIKGKRIGVIRHFWETDMTAHADLPGAMENAIAVFKDLGAQVETISLRPLQYYSDVKVVTAESELFSLHLPDLIARPGDFGQDFRVRSIAACLFTAEDYVRASRERRAIIEEMRDVYAKYDLLLTANTSAAPRLDSYDPLSFWTKANFTAPFNCTGSPALALPCGFTGDGLPLSLQIAGRPFADAAVLSAGHAFEQATGYWEQRPELDVDAPPAPLNPKPWQPDTTNVSADIRDQAARAARNAGLDLSQDLIEELVAVAPHALERAKRLNRDHPREAEPAQILDLTRERASTPA